MQAKESWFAARGNPKMKLQGSGASSREILQTQISLSAKNRFKIKGMIVVHGRLHRLAP
jgi:hypothetical protein